MKITVQIAIQSDEGQTAALQEVACLERGPLRPDTLGLSLAEARSILAGLEQTMAERQAAEFVAQERRCPRCGRQRACKGHHRIVFRTPLGLFQQRYVKRHEIWPKPAYTQQDIAFRGSQNQTAFRPLILGLDPDRALELLGGYRANG